MAERDQNEGSGQQPPIGQQDEKQRGGQSGQQPSSQEGQQPLGQQGDFGTQDSQGSQGGGQSATGEASQAGQAAALSEGSEPDLGDHDVGPGGYSPESGASDLGGGETGLGDVGGGGGFVGSQSGEDSGDYLQRDGNPQEGFAEQGRGAPDQNDVKRGTKRSDSRDSDIERGA